MYRLKLFFIRNQFIFNIFIKNNNFELGFGSFCENDLNYKSTSELKTKNIYSYKQNHKKEKIYEFEKTNKPNCICQIVGFH